MACIEFPATNVKSAVVQLINFLTDNNNFGAGLNWQLIDPSSIAAFDSECILKGAGDGEDEIYIGIQLRTKDDQTDIRFNGFAGYDPGLAWNEQPGCIYHNTLPIIPLPEDNRLQCWVVANSSRFIFVIQMSTQYEAAYVGFMKPVSVERQYPYPLVISGSHYDGGRWSDSGDAHSVFLNPGGSGEDTTLRLRRPDGTWESGLNKGGGPTTNTLCVWPQNTHPTNILTVLDTSLTIENVIMFPILLYECRPGKNDPAGIVGQLDGVYFVGNREDLSAKDTLIHKGKPYIVFSNVGRRDNDEYFAIEWF